MFGIDDGQRHRRMGQVIGLNPAISEPGHIGGHLAAQDFTIGIGHGGTFG